MATCVPASRGFSQGTSIALRFRKAETAIEREESSDRSEEGDLAPGLQRRVLVIDDDDGVRDVIVQALTDAGYLVTSAIDGNSGLATMDDFEPSAAVIDFLMPGMNGAEVARSAQVKRPELPIVFVSGYSDTLALEGVSGATVLRKPFDVQTLTDMVNATIATAKRP